MEWTGILKLLPEMIRYLRIENLKNHSLSCSTYLYSPNMGVPPPSGIFVCICTFNVFMFAFKFIFLPSASTWPKQQKRYFSCIEYNRSAWQFFKIQFFLRLEWLKLSTKLRDRFFSRKTTVVIRCNWQSHHVMTAPSWKDIILGSCNRSARTYKEVFIFVAIISSNPLDWW